MNNHGQPPMNTGMNTRKAPDKHAGTNRRSRWHEGLVGIATLGLLGTLGLIGSHVPRVAAQQPGTSPNAITDPQLLFEHAETLTSVQILILAEFLEAPGYGHAIRPDDNTIWRYTGLLMPIGAAFGANAIGEGVALIPDGIYWVLTGGTLFSEDLSDEPDQSQAHDFIAGELLVVGSAMAGDSNNFCRVGDCDPGYFACCYQETDGQQELVCKCVNADLPGACRNGGPGATFCEIWKRSVGGACEVKCDRDNGYRACCFDSPDPNDAQPVCVCYHIDDPPPAECKNGMGGECYRPNPSMIFTDTIIPFVEHDP
jgi:hypothetical protein